MAICDLGENPKRVDTQWTKRMGKDLWKLIYPFYHRNSERGLLCNCVLGTRSVVSEICAKGRPKVIILSRI